MTLTTSLSMRETIKVILTMREPTKAIILMTSLWMRKKKAILTMSLLMKEHIKYC